MKNMIKKLPIVGPLAQSVYRKWTGRDQALQGSQAFWLQRYESGGTSGSGSYIPNPYPFSGDFAAGSHFYFYIYEKVG